MAKKANGRTQVDMDYTAPGTNARFSNLGRIISSKVAQASLAGILPSDDFQQFTGDVESIVKILDKDMRSDMGRLNDIKKALHQLPNGLKWLVAVEADEQGKDSGKFKPVVSPEEICDFFNKVCAPYLPFKLKPQDMQFIAYLPKSMGHDDAYRAYWAVDLSPYENMRISVSENYLKKFIPDAFEALKSEMKELRDADATVQVGTKEDLEKYFRRDRSGIDKLKGGDRLYVVATVHGGDMTEAALAEVFNKLNKPEGEGGGYISGKDYAESDVVRLGSRRKKNPKTERFDDYDMFAVEVDEDKASNRAKKELEKEIDEYDDNYKYGCDGCIFWYGDIEAYELLTGK